VAPPAAPGDAAPSRLEPIGDDTWEEFTEAPFSVLMLATTTCPICKKWTAELTEWLETDEQWRHIRFGKLNLNAGVVSEFKQANREWLSDLPGVPFSVFFAGGEQVATLPGRGVKRLLRRLERIAG
jgi:hypothetical protein